MIYPLLAVAFGLLVYAGRAAMKQQAANKALCEEIRRSQVEFGDLEKALEPFHVSTRAAIEAYRAERAQRPH